MKATTPPANSKHWIKSVSMTPELAHYLQQHHSQAQDSIFDQIREATAVFGEDAIMQIPDHQGALLTILARLIGAEVALEIGTFTGASSISIARGLSDNGKLICMDPSETWTQVARRFWKATQLESRIDLQLGDAVQLLPGLDDSIKFDMVFIDAEKLIYDQLFELALPRVRTGGLIIFDNMLRGGRVVQDQVDERTQAIKKLNHKLANDPRIESVLVEVADGLQLCRKRDRKSVV